MNCLINRTHSHSKGGAIGNLHSPDIANLGMLFSNEDSSIFDLNKRINGGNPSR
jgi:hypothetical protein